MPGFPLETRWHVCVCVVAQRSIKKKKKKNASTTIPVRPTWRHVVRVLSPSRPLFFPVDSTICRVFPYARTPSAPRYRAIRNVRPLPRLSRTRTRRRATDNARFSAVYARADRAVFLTRHSTSESTCGSFWSVALARGERDSLFSAPNARRLYSFKSRTYRTSQYGEL